MNRKMIAEALKGAKQLRDQLIDANQKTAIGIELERKEMREKLGQHATVDALNDLERKMRAEQRQKFEKPAREFLMQAAEMEAHAKRLKDRERLLRMRPAPLVEPEIPDYISTSDGAKLFLATARVLHDAMSAMSFQMSLPNCAPDELLEVATDAAAARDYRTFSAVRSELRKRPDSEDARKALASIRAMLEPGEAGEKPKLLLPPEDEAAIEDAEALGHTADEIAQALHTLHTGDESVLPRAEGIRLITELGTGYHDVMAQRREERARAAAPARREPSAPRFKLPIAGGPVTNPDPKTAA